MDRNSRIAAKAEAVQEALDRISHILGRMDQYSARHAHWLVSNAAAFWVGDATKHLGELADELVDEIVSAERETEVED